VAHAVRVVGRSRAGAAVQLAVSFGTTSFIMSDLPACSDARGALRTARIDRARQPRV